MTPAQLSAQILPLKHMFIKAGGSGESNSVQVPCVLADLLWHTAMMSPQRYESECLSLAGCFVNHNDELGL